MAPAAAQPDVMPLLKFRMDNVVCIEQPASLSPSTIIRVGNQFWLRTDIGMEGFLAIALNGGYRVYHHVENIEAGARGLLPATPTDTFSGVLPVNQSLLSGPYNAAAAPLGIPAGFDSGTYRVTTHIHTRPPFPPGAATVFSAVNDGLIIQIIP